MFNKIKHIDMVSLLNYSVHAAQGDVFLCFVEFSVNKRSKIILMLTARLYTLKDAFIKRFP